MLHKTYFLALVAVIAFTSCNNPKSPIFESAEYRVLYSDGALAEGPAVDKELNLYFSDQPTDRVTRIKPDGSMEVVLSPSGVTNGIAFDHEGRMLLCQSNSGNYPDDPARGMRRVVRIEEDGSQTIMADRYNGQQFIAPNDLCVDKKGRIYFTDPYYPAEGIEKSQPTSGVYRIDAVGKVSLVISNLEKPNGILITPDNATIFVSDRGTQRLHRYKVLADGSLEHVEMVYDFSPDRGIDGMCMDEEGLIYGAAGEKGTTGIYVIDPESKKLIERKLFPEMAFNVTFGGEDGKNLYLAGGGSIYLMRTINRGVVLPSP